MKTLYSEAQSRKFIVLKIAEYRLGIPLEAVLRVINYPESTHSQLSNLGLLQVGSYTIRLVDLSQQLLSPESLHQPKTHPFLVIAKDSQGSICGIPVSQPPDLVEIPVEKIQLLPQGARQPGALQGVNHIAAISGGKDITPIFLLKEIDW